MSKIYGLVVVLTLMMACKPGIPKDVLKPEEMEKVLFDIHLVDGYLNYQGIPDTAKKIASAYYKGVYQKYDIDSATYNRSLNYYYNHPDKMKKMYDSIGARLGRLRDKQQKLQSVDHGYGTKPDASKPDPKVEAKRKADAVRVADSVKLVNAKLDSLRKGLKKPIKHKKRKKTVKGTSAKKTKLVPLKKAS